MPADSPIRERSMANAEEDMTYWLSKGRFQKLYNALFNLILNNKLPEDSEAYTILMAFSMVYNDAYALGGHNLPDRRAKYAAEFRRLLRKYQYPEATRMEAAMDSMQDGGNVTELQERLEEAVNWLLQIAVAMTPAELLDQIRIENPDKSARIGYIRKIQNLYIIGDNDQGTEVIIRGFDESERAFSEQRWEFWEGARFQACDLAAHISVSNRGIILSLAQASK